MLSAAGLLLAFLSALLFYLASPNCRLRRVPLPARMLRIAGVAAAVAALLLCCAGLGIGAGLAGWAGAWMLAALLLPWLALRRPAAETD